MAGHWTSDLQGHTSEYITEADVQYNNNSCYTDGHKCQVYTPGPISRPDMSQLSYYIRRHFKTNSSGTLLDHDWSDYIQDAEVSKHTCTEYHKWSVKLHFLHDVEFNVFEIHGQFIWKSLNE